MHLLRFLVLLFLFLVSCGTAKQTPPEESPQTVEALNAYLDASFGSSPIAGMTALVCDQDGVLYKRSFGKSDLSSERAFDEHTVMNIASISKTFLAVAIMRAVDQGKIALDDDVNDHLPFRISNPHFPNHPITIRQLVTHTSSIQDTKAYAHAYYFHNAENVDKKQIGKDMRRYWSILKENEYLDNRELIQAMLTPGGRYYKDDIYDKKNSPGGTPSYSNVAASLAAQVIEHATGMTYEEYTRQEILTPLGMQESWWNEDEIPAGRFTKRYYTPTWEVPNYSLITLADGGLLTTGFDLTKFTFEMIKGYEGQGSLLSREAYETMFSTQTEYPGRNGIGIIWELIGDGTGFAHNGGDPGIFTNLVYDSEKKRAFIMMTNTELSKQTYPGVVRIWSALKGFDFTGTN